MASLDELPLEDYNNPEVKVGKCHLCEPQLRTLIKYCPVCEHWFCRRCRKKYFIRGLAAVRQLIKGKQPGCCGPSED